MLRQETCPRCEGLVVDEPFEDELKCIYCGWRPVEIPDDVQREVDSHIGRSFIDHSRKRPPRGKPPLSGWEREKLRRQRQNGTS
ncbi:MAG: hypothetical protein FI707_11565 [SAR202 cluster bacterium]|nr:hypothetical protein [SAR202 cluster bacterium]HAL46759.1 hypothetical protein [Dehalococcoidia bacterium]MDP6662488.1 hypothetical protein [SAR202 cluster bacterium]MDP6800154.1 hypothetical protein [SAR202 cluster bacterium]MQG57368.1 hypothetical protein [SAR202 cluster bacterium]